MDTALAPPIRRTPIGSPVFIPDGGKPDWTPDTPWSFDMARRKRVSNTVVLGIMIFFCYINWVILLNEAIDPTSIVIYLIFYSVMSFFAFNALAKSVVGMWAVARNHHLTYHPGKTARDPGEDARVAIVFPVYHEDVSRVAAGIAACWESLRDYAPDYLHLYDIFIISDSRKPGFDEMERAAVMELRKLYPEARIYYRRRKINTNAKIGNITDFLRRWGTSYKYMFAMDADSVVTGETIHTTLRMIEGNPKIGVLQTNPRAILRTTIFGRMQQFAGNIFGRTFSASLQAIMMGNSIFMGHNSIIRLEPFLEHCILPHLPGKAPWGGKPLSHDIVESALMGAAGYETWFLPELKGSWEEIPANILACFIRERRWMQGNLQHARFIQNRSISPAYRDWFVSGVFAYVSAPLAAIFILISTWVVFQFMMNEVITPDIARTLITNMVILGGCTVLIFVSIRLMAIASAFHSSVSRGYGGKLGMTFSVILEFLFSLVYSPMLMLSITRFLYLWARRKSIVWSVQDRGDGVVSWEECWRHFGWMSVVGVGFTAGLFYLIDQIPSAYTDLMIMVSDGFISPYNMVYWMSPVLIGATFAPLIVRVTSYNGEWFRKRNLFLIPEEFRQPIELRILHRMEVHMRQVLPAH